MALQGPPELQGTRPLTEPRVWTEKWDDLVCQVGTGTLVAEGSEGTPERGAPPGTPVKQADPAHRVWMETLAGAW